jgi:glucuronate isomerase
MIDKRYLSSDIAYTLYESVANLPLICPHGHVDPRLFADENYRFGTPVDLLIIPDHYIFRMLYSQGIPLEKLGIPRVDGGAVETDHRKIWQTVCEHWHLFRGTPTGIWLRDELRDVFGITEKLTGASAGAIYTAIESKLAQPDFSPRQLFDRFTIEVLATTDSATDTLEHHQKIADSGWGGRVIPTFRPDAVVNIDRPDWRMSIDALGHISGVDITDYAGYIHALENRREFFVSMGAKATDHAVLTAYTTQLHPHEADTIFERALNGTATDHDAMRFTGHMLIEMARMSVEDGLVMQVHVGSSRNHNPAIFDRFGLDKGADMPIQAEFTRNLKPLLDAYGNDSRLSLILFTLDESTYSRELAPLAGHYPALKLGPPWWFFDSLNGMHRYFDAIIETAGLYNTAGFNDDTRAFLSIPARHDVWRRASADWLAGLVMRHIIDEQDAHSMIVDMAYTLAKRSYRLDK